MTGTNHGMTGAVIALLMKEPALAIPLSLVSHFACDSIPHYGVEPGTLFDRRFNTILIADFIVAVCLMVLFGFLFPAQKWVIWGSMIAAASPDLMWAYYHLYIQKIKGKKPRFDPLARFHSWIQWSQTPAGAFLEVFWFVLMGTIILAQR